MWTISRIAHMQNWSGTEGSL